MKVLFISTGGTIASKPGADGLVPKLDGAALVRMVPELGGICEIDCPELMKLDSGNMQPRHWSEIAETVIKNYDTYDGFVVAHGTDTMAYTSSALRFMLKGTAKPVAITGSQLPTGAPETDGKRNLLDAFRVASSGRAGVYLVFGGRVIFGDAAKKLHTKDLDAFASINRPLAARATDSGIEWTEKPPENLPVFSPKTALDDRVFVYRIIPGAKPDFVEFAVKSGYRAIVIEGFGAGGVPNGENSLLPAIKAAVDAGVIVVFQTQCLYDGTDLGIYETGALAAKAGAIPAGRMTTEAAAAKLMLALGSAESSEEAKNLFLEQN